MSEEKSNVTVTLDGPQPEETIAPVVRQSKWARKGLMEPLPGEKSPPPLGKERVWMKCRVQNACEGNYCWEEGKLGTGGASAVTSGAFPSTRYRCCSCAGVWNIATGSGFSL